MRILWIAKGHLTNNFAGVDGGANIRIPLMNQLHKLGHIVDFASYPLDMEFVSANISFLELQEHIESCAVDSYLYEDLASISHIIEAYDAVLLEVRPGYMFNESYTQNTIIDVALKHKKVVLVWDQDIWAEHSIDMKFRDKVVLLRPYSKANPIFPKQEFFPYFHHSVQLPSREPQYDLVYIGNRYEREYDFMTVMKPIHDLKLRVLISGDWVQKAPYVVREFPNFHWIGSTLHSYTLPLLQLGKCTIHIGRPIMRQYGVTPIRPFEAYMAERPCFVQQYDICDYIYKGMNANQLLFSDKIMCNEDIANVLCDTSWFDSFVEAQRNVLGAYSVEYAAARLLQIIDSMVDRT